MRVTYYAFPGLKPSLIARDKFDTPIDKKITDLINSCCKIFSLDKKLFLTSRTVQYTNVRAMLSNILRFEMSKPMSLSRIGQYLKKDHSTILYSIDVHRSLFKTDEIYNRNYLKLVDFFNTGTSFTPLRKEKIKKYKPKFHISRRSNFFQVMRACEVNDIFEVKEEDYLTMQECIHYGSTKTKEFKGYRVHTSRIGNGIYKFKRIA